MQPQHARAKVAWLVEKIVTITRLRTSCGRILGHDRKHQMLSEGDCTGFDFLRAELERI